MRYFFSDRTVKKWGFELGKPTIFYRFNLLISFIDLFILYSYAQGRWAFPKLWKAKKMQVQAAELVKNKAYLESLYQKISG